MTMISIAERIPDEASAYAYLEELRWGGTPECPHCGNTDRCYFLNPANGKTRATRTGAQSQRRVWKCGACRKQFSAITNTIMHGTKIPIRTWVFVIFEMCSNKNGIAAREIERRYGMTPRSAWHMTHRIREAMTDDGLDVWSSTVVADETFIGGKEHNKHAHQRQEIGGGTRGKIPVLTLINTETGKARSRVMPDVTAATLEKAIADQVRMSWSILYTDEARAYQKIGRKFAQHHTVNHSEGEYVRRLPGRTITTNRAENFFSQLKRSLDGTHHHVSRVHLHRYLAEFDFRYGTKGENDTERMKRLVGQVGGKRLAYRPLATSSAA